MACCFNGPLFPADVNECDPALGPSGMCGEGALCTNTAGSYSCACKPGYSGNPQVKCVGEFRRIKHLAGAYDTRCAYFLLWMLKGAIKN